MKTYLMRMTCAVASVIGMLVLSSCMTAPTSVQGKADIESAAAVALAKAREADPTLVPILDKAGGYVVFPTVAKGGVGVGGAYGKGVLYEGGAVVGYCDLTQMSVGLQLGGQVYTEILALETAETVKIFKQGNFRFDAQITAVALRSGASANAKFANGVAVFTMAETGLMYEASVGGQVFSYQVK